MLRFHATSGIEYRMRKALVFPDARNISTEEFIHIGSLKKQNDKRKTTILDKWHSILLAPYPWPNNAYTFLVRLKKTFSEDL